MKGATAMRTTMKLRMVIMAIGVLGLVMATTSSGLAARTASTGECPSGRVGLLVQWADAQLSMLCGPALGAAESMPTEIVGLVVRWSEDRKSTRLNSSHSQISYAVFCLKKKKKKKKKKKSIKLK